MVDTGTRDAYQFFMDMGSLKNADQYYGPDNFFWTQLKENPDYNSFWQERSIIPHLKENIRPAVMTVGGWFDAEDLYGPLTIYKTIEKHNPDTYNTLVMGPWSHGDWARERGRQQVANIYFGDSLSTNYQREIEATFFRHFLKEEGDGKTGLPEAYVFDTGKHGWASFEQWPPKNSAEISFYTHANGRLSTSPAAKAQKAASSRILPSPFPTARTLNLISPRGSTWPMTSALPPGGQTCSSSKPKYWRRTLP
ncbi:CocE/NonD family hydrolase [Nitritalea halalkaliphila]|uniref:CocE/NonD family hydrolase n=1 Tax=Nitritalea halalkaliphila TaxID=590849 RepID=UPI0029348501|nr:CocE/NonD family hydrolase [Nitritalea halalkaliphila]